MQYQQKLYLQQEHAQGKEIYTMVNGVKRQVCIVYDKKVTDTLLTVLNNTEKELIHN